MKKFLNRILNRTPQNDELACAVPDIKESRQKFYSQFIQDGDLVFDVGANIGNRVEPFLKLGAKVVAIEPQLECVKILRDTFENRIILVDKAIGAKEGRELIFKATENTISSFSKDWINSVKESGRFSEFEWTESDLIEMITLDSLISQYGLPSFIKIDVEGYELEVLRGLNSHVKFLSFEYTVPEQVDKCIACLDRLTLLNSNALFNYCKGERMELALPQWTSSNTMKDLVKAKEFWSTDFGDIYVDMRKSIL